MEFFKDFSKNYTEVRERKQAKMNPNFPLTLSEILQNIPFSEYLTDVGVTITKKAGTDNRVITLEIKDNDYGCTYDDFKKSLLDEDTEDGFEIEKTKANKFGQGLQNLVAKTANRELTIEMKKDGIASRVIMYPGAQRDRDVWVDIDDSMIEGPSGFYVHAQLKITNKAFKISSPERLVEEFYRILKYSVHYNLGRVNVSMHLVGFDTAFTKQFHDLQKLQKKTDLWVSEDLTTTTNTPPHELGERVWKFNEAKDIRIVNSFVGKRIGEMECAKYLGITKEEWKQIYFLAEYGDKPLALFRCIRTNLLFIGDTIDNIRRGSTGQDEINRVVMINDIDIQDDVWGVDQTKEHIMSAEMKAFITEKLRAEIDNIYPSEGYKEQALQSYLFDTFVEGDDHNAERLRHDSDWGFAEDLKAPERLEYIKKEDTRGSQRYDFSLKMKVNKLKIPTEIKIKPFKAPDIRQALGYYMQEKTEIVTLIGLDIDKQQIAALKDQVDEWKKGKMNKLAKWNYLDARKYGYSAIIEREYIGRVRDANKI